MYGWPRLTDTQALGHLLVQKAFPGTVGLNPFTVNDKLRDGTPASTSNYFVGRSGRGFDIDFCEGDVMLLQEALGGATVWIPKRRIDK